MKARHFHAACGLEVVRKTKADNPLLRKPAWYCPVHGECRKDEIAKEPLYSIGTWDTDLQSYTPQAGLTVPSQNVNWCGLLAVVRQLKKRGYSCHYRRDEKGRHMDNDYAVLIERTDGKKMDGRR